MGNFIFDEPGNPKEWYDGVIAEISFENKELKKLNFYQTHLDSVLKVKRKLHRLMNC